MKGGYEYPAVLGLASGALALAGAGKLSLDELFGNRFAGKGLALASVAATAAVTVVVLRRRRAVLSAEEQAKAETG